MIGAHTGLPWPAIYHRRGGGGPPPPYHADAVTFDGTAYLHNENPSIPDTPLISFSCWVNIPNANSINIWQVDPDGNYTSGSFALSNSPISTALFDITGGNPNFQFDSGVTYSDSAWHNIISSAETNLSAGNKLGKIYVDDVDVTHVFADAGAAFTMSYNGIPLWIGNDHTPNPARAFSIADLWIAPGMSLIQSGIIPEATRRLFISPTGKPVNPSGFPAASALFSGDATTFGTNQGNCGAFTLVGALTNAPTSPSD